ncbi:MAG: DedA family protein [Sporichthyaceae bacterium]
MSDEVAGGRAAGEGDAGGSAERASAPAGIGLPWEGKASRADKVILGAIVASGIYGLATLPLIPYLLANHPVLLGALRGGMTAIVNLGALARVGEVPILLALFVGLPATMMFDWAYWWAGRRWGERGMHMILGQSPRTEERLVKVKRLTVRFGPAAVLTAYFLPIPTALIYVAAGWAGMSLRTFLILDVAGTMLWLGLLFGLGYWIGQSAVDAVEAFADYSLWITIALVVLIVARQFYVARRR